MYDGTRGGRAGTAAGAAGVLSRSSNDGVVLLLIGGELKHTRYDGLGGHFGNEAAESFAAHNGGG